MLPPENTFHQPDTLFDSILEECSLASPSSHPQKLHEEFVQMEDVDERDLPNPDHQLHCWTTLEQPEKEQFLGTNPAAETRPSLFLHLNTISCMREEQEGKLAILLSSCRSLPLPQQEEAVSSEEGHHSSTLSSPKKGRPILKRGKKTLISKRQGKQM